MNRLITLKSGLRVYCLPVAGTRSVSVGMFIGAGSLYETAKNNGIAHFIEHMLFKGTESRSAYDIVNEMEGIGVAINAYTTKNLTAYYTVGLDEYAENCIDILSDLYFHSTFTEENIEREKGVVLEEISMGEDDGEDLCLELLCKAHYGTGKNISRPILGTKKTVKAFTRETVLSFMKEHYRADNTVISIVGNIDKTEALSLADRYFEQRFSPSQVEKQIFPCQPVMGGFIHKFKNIEQSNVGISFPSYGLRSKKTSVSSLLSIMLAGGMSSRLFQKIREEMGLVYNIYATPIAYVDDGYTILYFGTSPNQVEKALLAIRESLLEIREKGFSEEELQKAKTQIKTNIVLSGESSSTMMRGGGKMAVLLDETYSLDESLQEIDAVTVADIKTAVADLFDFGKVSMSYVGQKNTADLRTLFICGTTEEAL